MFHELVHAYRQTRRQWDHTELQGGLKWYGNQEEFLAVVLTNIYISDATNHHKSGLRADEYGGRPLEKGLSDSLSFFLSSPQVLPLLSKFRSEDWRLFGDLAEVNASFNPLQAMVKHPREVERLSHSKIASDREKTVPRLDIRPTPTHLPTRKDFEKIEAIMARQALQVLGH